MSDFSLSPFLGQRVRAPGSGGRMVDVYDDTAASDAKLALPPIADAGLYETAKTGALAAAQLPDLPSAVSVYWPHRAYAVVSRCRLTARATTSLPAGFITHELVLRRNFFGRGMEALANVFVRDRSPFLDGWDPAREADEKIRLRRGGIEGDPNEALGRLGRLVADEVFSGIPDERLAAYLTAICASARSGEPAILEFEDREFLARGALGIERPLAVFLVAAALVPVARATALSFRSYGVEGLHEPAPGGPAIGLVAVPKDAARIGRTKVRRVRSDGSVKPAFADDGTAALVATALSLLRSCATEPPREREASLRALRPLAAHLASASPARAAIWRPPHEVHPGDLAAAVTAACDALEPSEAVRLLDAVGWDAARDALPDGLLERLVDVVCDDAHAARYLERVLAGLGRLERPELLARICDAVATRSHLEAPLLRWLLDEDDLAGVVELLGRVASPEALRRAPCAGIPHGYRALASLLRIPGKPAPALAAIWSDEASSDGRELLASLALFGRAPRRWDVRDPAAPKRQEALAEQLGAVLAREAEAIRGDKRGRAHRSLFVAAQLDLAGSCGGCAALFAAAISDGGKDPDAWIVLLDRACPETTEWWVRALGAWKGALGADLRSVLPEVALRAPPLDLEAIAARDGAAALLLESVYRLGGRLGAHTRLDTLPQRAREHALWLSYYQR